MGKNYFSGRYSALLEAWEYDAYSGGYGSDWLEEIGENVRFYAMYCESLGKRPTFSGLIQHLKKVHDGDDGKEG